MTDTKAMEVARRRVEIETRLKAISGHWSVKVTSSAGGNFPHYSVCHIDTDPIDTQGSSTTARANVEFIAHAPEDIAWLVEQNRMLASELFRLMASRNRMERPMTWQTIDSAPKSTHVLVTWLSTWDGNGPHIEVCRLEDGDDNKPYWYYSYDGDAPNNPPTHWMPLPGKP